MRKELLMKSKVKFIIKITDSNWNISYMYDDTRTDLFHQMRHVDDAKEYDDENQAKKIAKKYNDINTAWYYEVIKKG